MANDNSTCSINLSLVPSTQPSTLIPSDYRRGIKAVEQSSITPMEIIRMDCGTSTQYIGSREQLIAAGFADESHFPEGRKRVKYSHQDKSGKLEIKFWSMQKLKGGRFKLHKQHKYVPLPEPKDEFFSSPESFKKFALCMITHDSFESIFGGVYELKKYKEKTIWFDEQSMQEILHAHAHLVETVKAAKVDCRRKVLAAALPVNVFTDLPGCCRAATSRCGYFNTYFID